MLCPAVITVLCFSVSTSDRHGLPNSCRSVDLVFLVVSISAIKIVPVSFVTQVELMTAVKDVLFPAAVESLFGEQFLQHHSLAHLQQAFFAFEAGFELAASPMPHWLQRGFCRARQSLLDAFR